jgi:hypothetical protein
VAGDKAFGIARLQLAAADTFTVLPARKSLAFHRMDGNLPGTSTWRMAEERRLIRRLLGIRSLIALAAILLAYYSLPMAIGLPLALVGLWYVNNHVLGRMDFLIQREQHAVKGAKAEEAVGAILDRLPHDYRTLHDVDPGAGNFDHVVFRNDGAVFLIETKSHSGKITIRNGQLLRDGRPLEKNFIHQTLDNVTRLKQVIAHQYGFTPSWIHAAIVFTNARVPLHCELSGVAIIRPIYLERWMGKQPGDMPTAQKLWPQIAPAGRH